MHCTVITDSIPPGIPIGDAGGVGGLSPGDIDGVDRLYGKAPAATTISTNPQGLELIVDGGPVTTPATLNRSPGSEHVLEASSPQTVAGNRFLFALWNDGGPRRHTVTASAGNTWIEANHIVQQRLVACADPTEAGEVRIHPREDDGHYTIRTAFEIEATPFSEGSRAFMNWHASGMLASRADRRSGRSSPGGSSNPAFGLARRTFPTVSEYSAVFSARPLFLIDSNVDGITIRANNGSRKLPWASPADEYPEGLSLEAPAMVPEDADRGTDVRYRFSGSSDGGERARSIAVPASGGSVSPNLARKNRLRIRANSRRDDELAVSISPTSEDGSYAAGTKVQVTAVPDAKEHFAGWTGEVSGHEPMQTVVMDAPNSLEAVFTSSAPLNPNEKRDVLPVAGRSYRVYGQ